MTITAKFASVCPCCNLQIQVGSSVEWAKGSKARHVYCAARKGAVSAPSATRPARSSAYRSVGGSAAKVAGYSSYCTGREGCGCYDCQ